MGWKEFAASVIGDVLSWPVVVLIVVLLLLEPLRKLIGRVKGAKGFGGEVEFGELLEKAEDKVNKVLDEDPVADDDAAHDVKPNPVSSEKASEPTRTEGIGSAKRGLQVNPAKDPSGAILISWEKLVAALAGLSRSTAGRGRPARNPRAILDQLQRNNLVSDAFHEAVVSLYEVRNQVAHGEAVPTSGAAFTYVERAEQLATIATGIAAVETMDLDKSVL
ncbi:hypothetical protein [Populibacterium corticicola]